MDCASLARAFVAKAVRDLSKTYGPVDRIEEDSKLRRLCGWSRISHVPCEATYLRAFKEFAETDLPGQLHRALVEEAFCDMTIGRVPRDSTATEARKKSAPKPKKRKRDRPPKGE